MAELICRVTPNARRSEILGWDTDENGRKILRVKLKAPPVDGEANKELLSFLSKELGVPKSRLSLKKGEKNRVKRIEIDGLGDLEIESRISKPL